MRRLVALALVAAAVVSVQTVPANAAPVTAPAPRGWVETSPAPDDPAPTPSCTVGHEHDIQVSRSRYGRYVSPGASALVFCDAPIEARIVAAIIAPNGDAFRYRAVCALEELCGGMSVGAAVGCLGDCAGVWTITTTVRVRLVPPLPWGTVPRWCATIGAIGDELVCRYRTRLAAPDGGRVTRTRQGIASTLL